MNSTEKENLAKLSKIVYHFQKKRFEMEPNLHHLEEIKKTKMDCGTMPEDRDAFTEHQYRMIKKSFDLSRYFLNCKFENQFNATVSYKTRK